MHLTEPVTYKSFFEPSFLNESHIKAALNSAILHQAKENFRIWVERSENSNFSDIVIQTPLFENESIEEWTKRIFKENKFCLLFSQVEQFNDDLAVLASQFLKPLFEKRGITLGGTSLTVFLGNYGFTPSGVHQDQDENCIFHFHLGPGYKELMTWDPHEFEKLTGSKEAYFETEKILPHAKVFGLYPNDFLFLPTKYYHIGKTDQFSVDFVVVLSDCSNIKLTEDIFNNLMAEGLARNKKTYKLDLVDMEESITTMTRNMMNHLCINPEKRQDSFENVIKSQMEDRYLSMLSNFNFSYPPRLNQKSTHDLKSRSIKIKEPFKIYYKKIENNKMAVFFRGRELVAPHYPFIVQLIDHINISSTLNVEDVTKQFATNDQDKKIILSFLSQAIEHHAIKLIVAK